MRTSQEINEISAALAIAQTALENPEKTKEAKAGSYKYKYADIADVLRTARPVLAEHKIAVIQFTEMRDDQLILLTRLAHSSGQWLQSEYPICQIGVKHQDMGGALTYARRYALCSLIGIAAEDDLDGQASASTGEAPRKRMSAHQAKKEINWKAITDTINTASSLQRLENVEARIKENEDIWPLSYLSEARALCDERYKELTAEKVLDTFSEDEAQPVDPDKVLADFQAELSTAQSADAVREVWDQYEHFQEQIPEAAADKLLDMLDNAMSAFKSEAAQ